MNEGTETTVNEYSYKSNERPLASQQTDEQSCIKEPVS